ncbi:hypothetical protein BDM02DRAFT_3190620 [Thelephora ganbajun]|uniref:Uncharacterized protein n=1 Tax=Thelephora ganbajun TaxID=370292 RepID=A0ACB6Z5I3_THEGA|nr:hypothetical protein BDM02DRAFT_3190620 [Thelephora ganbajun]
MDDMRARTLETLSSYIQSQRELLSRTQSEIERLHTLKKEVKDEEDLTLGDGVFGLDEEAELDVGITRTIDWSLFQSKDPTFLNELADKSRAVYTQRNQPPKIQYSEPSYLQTFVRDSKIAIIDPLFAYLKDDPLFIEAQTEAEAQAQLPPTVDSTHSVKTPKRCPVGVSYRRLPALRLVCNTTSHADNTLVNPTFMEVDLLKQPHTLDTSLSSTPTPCLSHVKAVGGRRSSRKAPRPPPSPPRKAPPKAKDSEKLVQTANGKPKRSRGPKSDTFKMAWSVEEQRLLERLLEEIPDGEKNRWAKISQAMNGRRTPRQVASRVQKYFEKLKKFGIEV